MSFDDRFAITDITKQKWKGISMSIDEFDNIEPIMLYSQYREGDGKCTEHDHIHLSNEEAKALYEWLGRFLSMNQKELSDKYQKDLKNK